MWRGRLNTLLQVIESMHRGKTGFYLCVESANFISTFRPLSKWGKKMRVLFRGRIAAVILCIGVGATGWAQQIQKPVQPAKIPIDVTATFAAERSKADPSLCCFWFKGGGLEAATTLWKGFGIAATLTGDHASGYLPSTDENKVSVLIGPRFTFTPGKGFAGAEGRRRLQFFGQGLVGVAHGFETRFSNGATSANELAIQAGGGLNLYSTKRIGIRPIEIEFVRTQIGVTGFSTQNDMRLATGLTYHFSASRPALMKWPGHAKW
jgi:hypothetical protein